MTGLYTKPSKGPSALLTIRFEGERKQHHDQKSLIITWDLRLL